MLNTTLCDKICQRLAAGRWFSPGTPVSSTHKTDHHSIAELVLNVVLNTITLLLEINPDLSKVFYLVWDILVI
jgi:hypothetical protein